LELDETYFGGKRKGKRGRGAYNKAIVFGILERNGKVYTRVIPNVTAKTLMSEMRRKARKGSVFYTDCFKSYKSLKQYGKHLKVNKQYTFAAGRTHINGIEGFWSYAKERFHQHAQCDHRINSVSSSPMEPGEETSLRTVQYEAQSLLVRHVSQTMSASHLCSEC